MFWCLFRCFSVSLFSDVLLQLFNEYFYTGTIMLMSPVLSINGPADSIMSDNYKRQTAQLKVCSLQRGCISL